MCFTKGKPFYSKCDVYMCTNYTPYTSVYPDMVGGFRARHPSMSHAHLGVFYYSQLSRKQIGCLFVPVTHTSRVLTWVSGALPMPKRHCTTWYTPSAIGGSGPLGGVLHPKRYVSCIFINYRLYSVTIHRHCGETVFPAQQENPFSFRRWGLNRH